MQYDTSFDPQAIESEIMRFKVENLFIFYVHKKFKKILLKILYW